MNYSELSKDILAKAEEIRILNSSEYISAPCIIAAVAHFCGVPYKGITPYDDRPYPEWYEEERLRYIYGRIFKAGADMINTTFTRRLSTEFWTYDRDFLFEEAASLEECAKKRNKGEISAENIFLAAVKKMHPDHRKGANPEFKEDFSIDEIISETDSNILDYVIDEIEKITAQLNKKVEIARQERDWKPAEKFAEPEAVLSAIFGNVKPSLGDNTLNLTLENFFSCKNEDLNLEIAFCEGFYYVHDNGCALHVLQRNVQDRIKFNLILDKIKEIFPLRDTKAVYEFGKISEIFSYLQMLIFIANADLYWRNLTDDGFLCDTTVEFIDDFRKEAFNTNQFLEALKRNFECRYDQNRGISLRIGMTYSANNTPVGYIFKKEETEVSITDFAMERTEGSIFENLIKQNKNISDYSVYIKRVCRRFGCDFNDGQLSLTFFEKNDSAAELLKFVNAAVLLSELGRAIDLS